MYKIYSHFTLGFLAMLITMGALTSAGSLDTTFDTDGKVTTDFDDSIDYGWAVALQPDGKIVVTGPSINNNGTDFALARYNTDGSLDATFDADGKVVTDFGSEDDGGYDLAIQPDGKIVVAGSILTVQGDNFALARYNSDGSLDLTFDSDGKVTTAFGSGVDRGYAVAVQSDGKIVAAGYTLGVGSQDFALARYNSDGSLDTGFGVEGKVTTDLGGDDRGNAIVNQPSDGKIIVAGDSNGSFALARYNNDGSLDTTFDGDGKVTATTAGGDFATDVALQPDGKIVAAGFGDNISDYRDFVLMRFNSDGSLDTTFDMDGKVATDFGSEDDGRAIVIQPDGKIVMVGATNVLSSFALARYNDDGSLDSNFGVDGKVITVIGSSSVAYAVALQSDGKILTVGSSYNGSNLDFALARYLGVDAIQTVIKSTDAQDGWLLESSETSGVGGSSNKTASTLRLGDDAANRQYRAILSFDTPTLPEGAILVSVTLQIKHAGLSGINPFTTHGKLLADICKGAFKDNPGLQLGDFKAACGGGRNSVLRFTKSKIDNWYAQSLRSGDYQYINFGGVTQFRLRFNLDDNNDFGADYLKLYSGNADPANQPQLVIEYYVPVP